MTATIAAPSPADTARAVLDRGRRYVAASREVAGAWGDLLDAIEMHELIRDDRLSWECYDTDLAVYAEPHIVAVDKSAEDAAELAGMLAEVIEKHLGRETAEFVSNGGTENAA